MRHFVLDETGDIVFTFDISDYWTIHREVQCRIEGCRDCRALLLPYRDESGKFARTDAHMGPCGAPYAYKPAAEGS